MFKVSLPTFVAYKRATVNARWLSVLLVIPLSAVLMAQVAPKKPAKPKGVQEFLSVPIWYLSYNVTLKAKAEDVSEGDNGAKTTITTSSERIINGSMRLGMMGGGPSLSMKGGNAQNVQALMDRINDFMTWLPGLPPDESKSDEAQWAEMQRIIKEDTKAFERFSYLRETVNESPWELGGGMQRHITRTTLGGAAPVMGGHFVLEIDVANKKYKLHVDHTFHDSEESIKAATGESVDFVGEDRENHVSLEQGIESGREGISTIEPPRDFVIDGTLPGSVGNLSGESTVLVRWSRPGEQDLKGTLHFSYTLSPAPPELAELIIEPPPDYEQWRPIASENEKITGDLFPIKVVLRKKGGGELKFKAQRFIYYLRKTSREKGICMNWPPKPEADTPFDLQFEPSYNKDLVVVDQKGQAAQQSVERATQGEVVVSCFDYGANGEFEAIAELENGQTVNGIVKGTKDQRYLKLPARKDGSLIASSFLKGLGDLKDDDDSENDPVGDSFKGDGLTLYEEYRGFMDGDDWIPGDPKKKDVFVLNQMRGLPQALRGIKLFEKATGLKVHKRLKDNQVDAGMMINFNRTAGPHVVDQHVIRIRAGPTDKTSAFVEEVGTPGTAKSVNVSLSWEEFRQVGTKRVPSFERTIAHEMSHDCNIYHHGQADKDVTWEYVAGPPGYINERGFGPITVKWEDGLPCTAASLFPNPASNNVLEDLQLGVPHGQHSGHADCLMRYWVAWGYPSLTDPSVRYLSPGEVRGVILCNTTAGTGINAADHKPQSRYRTAATPANGGAWVKDDRGKCKDQLRVNDRDQEPER